MAVKLAFLGTGTCSATERNPASCAVSDGKEVVLIDCGGGCYHQLARLGRKDFPFRSVNLIVLTHYHVDHVAGLPDFFWGEMWDTRGRRSRPLTILGPPGLNDFIDRRFLPFIGDHEIPFEFEPVEIQPGERFSHTFCDITSYHLIHGPRSSGYLFSVDGTKLAITGDTGYCDNLLKLARESDILVMEWAIRGFDDHEKHINGEDMKRLVTSGALPERVYITHVYPENGLTFEEQAVEMKRAVGVGSGRLFFPVDWDVIEIA